MTASLYQSASAGPGAGAAAPGARSGEVVEARVRSSEYTEDMGRKRVGAELDVVVRSLPQVAPAAEQVLDEIFLAFGDAELGERQADEARLDVVRIQIDDDQDQVGVFLLRIANQLIVRNGMEAQAPVRLQRRVL